MSRNFNEYLVDKLITFLYSVSSKRGKKYYIKFDTDEMNNSFYSTLEDVASKKGICADFIVEEVGYRTYSLLIDNTQIIIAKEIPGEVTLDFLTNLRNRVGAGRKYDNHALMFLVSGKLDSIVDGTESLHREGLPFHYIEISRDIGSRIEDVENNLSMRDRIIIKQDVKSRENDKYIDKTSLELYKPILDIINDGKINDDQYKSFGMFFDSALRKVKTEKEVEKRIKENKSAYKEIEDALRAKGIVEILGKKYSDSLINKLKKLEKDVLDDNWSGEFDYTSILKDRADKKNQANISIVDMDMKFAKGGFYTDIQDFSGSEPGRDKKYKKDWVVVYNDSNSEQLNIDIELSDKLTKKDVEVIKVPSLVEANGKTLRYCIELSADIIFEKITIQQGETGSSIEINICVVPFGSEVLKLIIPKIDNINVNKRLISLKNVDDNLIFNHAKDNRTTQELRDKGCYTINGDTGLLLKTEIDSLDQDKIPFKFVYVDKCIDFIIATTQAKSTEISGLKLFAEKLVNREYIYDGKNKLAFKTTEYRIDCNLKDKLDRENAIIETGMLCGEIHSDKLISKSLDVQNTIKTAYNNILKYYKCKKTSPSICPVDLEAKKLYVDYLESINAEVGALDDGEPITDKDIKNVYLLGSIYDNDKRCYLLSPFHPINIAHQLALLEVEDKTMNENRLDIVRRINSRYVYPYFYSENSLFKVIDDEELPPEWKKYVISTEFRKNGSREFVSDLIYDKMLLFIKHFECIFLLSNNNELRINIINMGDCKEVFDGILKYYLKNRDDSLNILISIYNDKTLMNFFEILSDEVHLKSYIKELKQANNININEFISELKSKLSYYVKSTSEKEFNYSHLSFFEIPSEINIGQNNMDNIESGVSYNGILSGLTSKFIGNSYRTSFGSKDMASNITNDTYRNLNALAYFSQKSDPFSKTGCISTEVKNDKTELMLKIYESSHWVTFIDPKVDLNFFLNDDMASELTIIHYQDQYTTTSGYDAITVTNKTTQYKRLIINHMEKHGILINDGEANKIINSFNAINGNWLLNLISSSENYDKEKISLVSAVKMLLAKHSHEKVIWIPIAMEEILRVTGAVKLSAKSGFLSARNLGVGKGPKSDDLLMVGINISNVDSVKVYLHPVEVKIGGEPYIGSSLAKAKDQINSVKDSIYSLNMGAEGDSDFIYALRSNYLMQLTLVAAQKLKMYRVWDDQNWDAVLSGDVRKKLLNEDYSISNEMDEILGKGTIMQFVDITEDRKIIQCIDDDISIIRADKNFALKTLVQDIKDIKADSNFEIMVDFGEFIKHVENCSWEASGCNNGDEIAISNDTEDDFVVDEEDIAIAQPLDVADIKSVSDIGMEITFGDKQNGDKFLWHPNNTNELMNTNTGIIGTMGTGKTQFTKSIITQLANEGKHNIDAERVGILIFDYKGDYNHTKKEFVNATDAKVYNLYNLPFNPLSIVVDENPKPMLPMHVASTFAATLSKAYSLGVKQNTLLREVIIESYKIKGILPGVSTSWTNTAPTLHDVYNCYMDRENIKEDSLYAAMSALESFSIFEGDASNTKSLFELLDGVVVIDLSGYDVQIQNLVVAITLDLFYSQMHQMGSSKLDGNLRQIKKMILVDEADNFLSRGFESIKKILKEGREFGVGTILSTQLLSHFSNDNDDYANYIFTWVVHNVSDLSGKDVRKIFVPHTKQDEDRLFREIKGLEKHRSLIKTATMLMSEKIEDLPFYKLISPNS